MKTYDMLLIFPTSMNEGQLEKATAAVTGEVERQGGAVIGTTYLGRRQFARRLKKQAEGHYTRIKISLDPATVAALSARLKLNTDVFRFQITLSTADVEPAAPDTPADRRQDDVSRQERPHAQP